MMPKPTFADEAAVLAAGNTSAFSIRRSPEAFGYHELLLQDAQGSAAHWVIPQPLKQLPKGPMMLWLLPTTPLLNALTCVESGTACLAPAQPGTSATLQAELAQGILRLNFNGQLLRGYYRLQQLPTGCGQLWQLLPIGHA